VTNVYGPTLDSDRDDFFEDIRHIYHSTDGPWIIAGDFNTICSGEDRSTATFTETSCFNDAIRDLQIQELPLLDRDFTWSNLQDPPILTRIDIAFINANWDSNLPNTTLHSIPRVTSDHCPLKIEASPRIPKSKIFHYENNWKFREGFTEVVTSSWWRFTVGTDTTKGLGRNLKHLRRNIGFWRKTLNPNKKILETNKFVLAFLDWLEEGRALSKLEGFFRIMVKQKIENLVQFIVVAARQRGKVNWCKLGDEDTRLGQVQKQSN
jgi:hypothetical protein